MILNGLAASGRCNATLKSSESSLRWSAGARPAQGRPVSTPASQTPFFFKLSLLIFMSYMFQLTLLPPLQAVPWPSPDESTSGRRVGAASDGTPLGQAARRHAPSKPPHGDHFRGWKVLGFIMESCPHAAPLNADCTVKKVVCKCLDPS